MPHDMTVLLMWTLTAVALAIAGYGVYEMVKVWRKGRDWKPGDWKTGMKRFLVAIFTHRKFMQQRRPGTMHAWIFFGFFVLFVGTTLAFIDMDIFEMLLDSKLLYGDFYLWYEATLDAFGVVLIMGVLYAMKRRVAERPPQLHTSRHPESPLPFSGDMYALWALLLIAVTGFLLEGMRLRHQIDADGITHASWSFVGNLVAVGFVGMSEARLMTLYPVLWWFHFALWTSILAVLPWTKFKHIVTSSLNVYFFDPRRLARPELSAPFDLKQMMESGDMDLPDVGVSTIREFTWKDRLSLDACTNCGRCELQCPATRAGRPLSPRKLIQDLKVHMWEDHRAEAKATKTGQEYTTPKLTVVDGLSTSIDEATLWSCTTCRACVTECPVDINHVDMIMDMRRALVMESRLDEHQQKLLVNITNSGNPYGFAMSDRDDWRNSLPDGVTVPTAAEKMAAGEPIELLWWVGCSGSFDPRNQEVTRSIARIYNAAEVEFAILGNEEKCTGDPARRLGEEGRFQQSVIENLMVLEQYGIKKVVTQCPHCFNALANEYPQFGADLEVLHHSQFIEQLIEQERVPLRDAGSMKITYHDSCYLGRHNGIFEAPRRILERTGYPVLEMVENRAKGLCCGAGGSNMWYEIGQEQQRINVLRVKQAQETEADTVASACPFCLTMVNDGIGLTGNEGKMQAKDIAEIVAEHLDWPRGAPVPGGTSDAGSAGNAAPSGPARPASEPPSDTTAPAPDSAAVAAESQGPDAGAAVEGTPEASEGSEGPDDDPEAAAKRARQMAPEDD